MEMESRTTFTMGSEKKNSSEKLEEKQNETKKNDTWFVETKEEKKIFHFSKMMKFLYLGWAFCCCSFFVIKIL